MPQRKWNSHSVSEESSTSKKQQFAAATQENLYYVGAAVKGLDSYK